MANGWSSERRAAQRKAIYRWRPWAKSTGPKTKAGKAMVSKNAWKHGSRSGSVKAQIAAFRQFLSEAGG